MFEFLLRRHMPDRALIHYRAGLLDKERSEMLETHLLLCPTCQLQLEDLLPQTARPSSFCSCAEGINPEPPHVPGTVFVRPLGFLGTAPRSRRSIPTPVGHNGLRRLFHLSEMAS